MLYNMRHAILARIYVPALIGCHPLIYAKLGVIKSHIYFKEYIPRSNGTNNPKLTLNHPHTQIRRKKFFFFKPRRRKPFFIWCTFFYRGFSPTKRFLFRWKIGVLFFLFGSLSNFHIFLRRHRERKKIVNARAWKDIKLYSNYGFCLWMIFMASFYATWKRVKNSTQVYGYAHPVIYNWLSPIGWIGVVWNELY